MAEKELTAGQAIQTVENLAAAGLRCWVIGGWGIDALLGEQTRAHHDLDLLVAVADLPSLDAWLREQRFCRAYEWPENVPARLQGKSWDTAFVEHHVDGRELDIHAVRIEGGSIVLATTDPWELPSGSLDGLGKICGRAVACVSAEAQRALHRGYDLPERHREDLSRLDRSCTVRICPRDSRGHAGEFL
jgi:lincosamide nucleotidyltransferase A/C/D/E